MCFKCGWWHSVFQKLFLKCADGTSIPSAVLSITRQDQKTGASIDYLKWTFSEVRITSYQEGGSEADARPLDQVSFNFRKIEVSYDGAGGNTKAGWDLKNNEAI